MRSPDLACAPIAAAVRLHAFADGHCYAAEALRKRGDEIAAWREDAYADAAMAACWSTENDGTSLPEWIVVRLGATASTRHRHPHLLRHSCVTLALAARVPMAVVAAGAAHRDVRSTTSYATALCPARAEAGVAVAGAVAGAAAVQLRALAEAPQPQGNEP